MSGGAVQAVRCALAAHHHRASSDEADTGAASPLAPTISQTHRGRAPLGSGFFSGRPYAAAVELLAHIRGLMVTLGVEAEFAAYLTAVRVAHGRKRNFTSMLAAMDGRSHS
jgi:hypothetical protein